MEITFNHKIVDGRIDDLLTGAFEGGSNYWYQIDNETEPFEGFAGEAWRKNDGILIVDLESDDEEPMRHRHRLNRESVSKGLEILARKYPKHFADFIDGNYDAITSDGFLQCCIFEDWIYG